MPLISIEDVGLAHGEEVLLDRAGLVIERGERVCLLGRNGAGKSTLLRVLLGEVEPDAGTVRCDAGVRVAALPQDVPTGMAGSVREVVAGGLGELGALLAEHARSADPCGGAPDLGALERLQRRIEAAGGWEFERRIERTLTRLALPAEARFETLSGGLARRTLLARALVAEPDLLLLDEPTNHLDMDAIVWLEDLLAAWRGSLMFTTHDRRFLQRLATRIVELDRGALTSWPGDYDEYLRRREARLAAEARERERFDAQLAREEAWIREGVKARRTRNEGRVRRLQAMRAERRRRREVEGRARFDAHAASPSGRRVIEAQGAGFAWPEDGWVLRDVTTLIERGDRIGVIGPNGSGKTTLLRLLVGDLTPSSGRVRHGTRLEIVYFDQHRASLDDRMSVAEAVADGTDFVEIAGRRRHVMGYLQDFLFTPSRARQPVSSLSGGERARLLLARLFARPSNLLVMDEPTNDLDIETLELLEERLSEYPGTALLVSHDREFLDKVVTSTLVLEDDGRVGEYIGGYSDWLRQRPDAAPRAIADAPDALPSGAHRKSPSEGRRKLGYREQRELAALPERIEALEAEIAGAEVALADPELYRSDAGERIAELKARLEALRDELESAYARWAALEDG